MNHTLLSILSALLPVSRASTCEREATSGVARMRVEKLDLRSLAVIRPVPQVMFGRWAGVGRARFSTGLGGSANPNFWVAAPAITDSPATLLSLGFVVRSTMHDACVSVPCHPHLPPGLAGDPTPLRRTTC